MLKQLFLQIRQIFCRRREERLYRIRERARVRLNKSIMACAEGCAEAATRREQFSDDQALRNLCYQEGYFHAVHSQPPVLEKMREPGYLPGYEDGVGAIIDGGWDYRKMRQGYTDALYGIAQQSSEQAYMVGYQNGEEVKSFTHGKQS